MGSLVGVAVAAVAIIGGIELRGVDRLKSIFGGDFDPGQYRMLIFGLATAGDDGAARLIASRQPSIVLHEAKAVAAANVKEGRGVAQRPEPSSRG